jgi:membrane fusion protein, multidrug efflux system
MMKQYKWPLILVLLLAVLLLIKKVFFPAPDNSSTGPGKPGAFGGGAPSPVEAYVVKTQEHADELLITGSILANEAVVMKAEIQARIIALFFKEGESVKKGDLLIQLNDVEIKAQIKKLNSQIKLAEDKLKRIKELLDVKGVAIEEYETAQNQLEVLKADLSIAEAQLDKTRIVAPFDGVIGLRNISAGAVVNPNDELITIQQIDALKLEFSIPSKYASSLLRNTAVRFTVSGQQDTLRANVYAYNPSADLNTRSITMRAMFSNQNRKLLPGMFARLIVEAEKDSSAIFIPTVSIIPVMKGKQVMLNRGGKAVPQAVVTGTRKESMILIKEGLQPGDTVVTMGVMGLRPGADIRITKLN